VIGISEGYAKVNMELLKEEGYVHEDLRNAIGHPLGATGCRLVGTLARILNEKGARYGCANACCGGGQGVATIIEKEDY
jgi:acetyl-CoA C-acetyltransferase